MNTQENIAHATKPSRASGRHDIDIRNTRYAVLWARTRNLGDDIQTLATMHALAKLGIHEYTFIEQESIHQYQGPPVTMVMNGWFTRAFECPPPPDTITPIFISFHSAQDYFIRLHVDYFKKHEPIGCRDASTIELLQYYGIATYFSGCMSLCFDKSEEKRNNRVHMVDPYWIRRSRSRCLRSHALWRLHNIGVDLSPWDPAPYGYYHYQHLRKHEMQHLNLDERLSRARRLLDLYRKAGLVITSCVHCALSCRAFGTDVLFVHKEYNNDPQFSGLHDYLNGTKERRLRMENRTASERMTKMINKKCQELIDMLGDLLAKSSTR